MRESDIMYESQRSIAFVVRERGAYCVAFNKGTHSEIESKYARNEDGLSIAKARCDYLDKRAQL